MGKGLTSISHTILYKPLATFPYKHIRNNDRSERRIYTVQKDITYPKKIVDRAEDSNQQPFGFVVEKSFIRKVWVRVRIGPGTTIPIHCFRF